MADSRIIKGNTILIRNSIATALAVFASTLAAQTFPAKPLRVIVPSLPGGNLDLVARTISAQLALGFKQQVVVENRAGCAVCGFQKPLFEAGH